MMMISMRLRINYEMGFNERPEYLTGLPFDYRKSRALAVLNSFLSSSPVGRTVAERKFKKREMYHVINIIHPKTSS